MLQLSQIRLCQDYSMTEVKSVWASLPIMLCTLCILAVQSTTITLEQRSAESCFEVSVLALHRHVPFLV